MSYVEFLTDAHILMHNLKKFQNINVDKSSRIFLHSPVRQILHERSYLSFIFAHSDEGSVKSKRNIHIDADFSPSLVAQLSKAYSKAMPPPASIFQGDVNRQPCSSFSGTH